jgi:hypothetical protein
MANTSTPDPRNPPPQNGKPDSTAEARPPVSRTSPGAQESARHLQERLDEALDESFPASDPPAVHPIDSAP